VTLTKSARYALYAAVEMAAAGDTPVTVGQVAAPHGIPPTALAKVLQQLVRAGIAAGTRGVGGGYRLARPRHAVTVLDIVSVFEPGRVRPDGRRGPGIADPLGRPQVQALHHLFDEVDEGTRATLASVTLETLVR